MDSTNFAKFCEEQVVLNANDREARKALTERLSRLSKDVAQIHESRHATQEKVAMVVDDMRCDHNTLESQVTVMANSMQTLVVALQGAYGGPGLVTRVSEIKTDVANIELEFVKMRLDFEATRSEGRGMLRLIGWGGALIGTTATVVSLVLIFKR